MARYPHLLVFALTLALTPSLATHAASVSVYTWVDSDGVTQFSQIPPAQRPTGVRQFTLKVPAPAYTPPVQPAIGSTDARLRARIDALEHKLADQKSALQQTQTDAGGTVDDETAPWLDETQTTPYVVLRPPRARHARRDDGERHERDRRRDHHRQRDADKLLSRPASNQKPPDLYQVPQRFYRQRPPPRWMPESSALTTRAPSGRRARSEPLFP